MRKRLILFLLPLIPISSGCATSGLRDGWSKSVAAIGLGPKETVSKEFREAQRVFKDPETTLLSYARMKEDNEEYAEAREKYREFLIGYPNNVEARLGMARIEIATGRMDQAYEILTTLAEKYPANASVRTEMGRMYSSQDNWTAAIEHFQKASEINPSDQMIRYELGLACVRANRTEEAVPHLSFAVGESAAMYNIGYVLQDSGRNTEAIEWYQKALASHPDARTAFQSQQMLSKLTQSEEKNNIRIAAINAEQMRAAVSSRPSQANSVLPSINSSPNSNVSQFTSAQTSNAPGSDVTASQAAYQQSSSTTAQHAFRTASYGVPVQQESATSYDPNQSALTGSADAEPTQWRGPAASVAPVRRTSATAIQPQPEFEQPPVWQARSQR